MWRSDAGYKSNMRSIVQCEAIKYMFNIIYLNECTFDTDNPQRSLRRKICKLIISNTVVHILRRRNYVQASSIEISDF
jgi:hypothetical protein